VNDIAKIFVAYMHTFNKMLCIGIDLQIVHAFAYAAYFLF